MSLNIEFLAFVKMSRNLRWEEYVLLLVLYSIHFNNKFSSKTIIDSSS
jgi:hypothetical protein